MTSALNLDILARVAAERMLNCVAEGIVITLFAWTLLRLTGRRNSSTRFAVWFAALLLIVAMPILGGVTSNGGVGRTGFATSAITLPGSWAVYILPGWSAIAGIALVRIAAGLLQIRKLRRTCTVIEPASLNPTLQQTLQEFRQHRPVTLCVSDRVNVPAAVGFLRPMIVLPAWAMRDLSSSELNSILIHEMAHLQRWDDWTNLAQKVVRALLFFHPAVWWIETRLSLEREMACDDVVLAKAPNPRAYAQCLVSVAEKSFLRRGFALAQAAVNRMRHTSLRISQILDGKRSAGTRVWQPALYLVAAFSIVGVVSLSHAPELVAFKDPVQSPVMAAAIAPTASPILTSASDELIARIAPTAAVNRAKAAKVKPAAKPVLARRARSREMLEAEILPPPQLIFSSLPQAEAIMPGEDAPNVSAVLVVMRSQEYGNFGPVVWTICVWRVDVLDAGHALAEKIPAKSI